MVNALLHGDLTAAKTAVDPVFGLATPTEIPGVPTNVLRPRDTWKDHAAYDAQAQKLAGMFRENFTKFESFVSEAVRSAGPRA
jgi:phosphoenolpyruvate carboxykinase (ATP)